MRRRTFIFLISILVSAGFAAGFSFSQAERSLAVYLTFPEADTSTNITINNYIKSAAAPVKVYFDTQSRHGKFSAYESQQLTQLRQIPGTDRFVHSGHLKALQPNTKYYFVIGSNEIGFSQEFYFKTLPNDSSPVRFIQGGDMRAVRQIVETAKPAMATEPDVILIGGDIAYANGKVENFELWDIWFRLMNEVMVQPDGRMLPLIVAIGNHEADMKLSVLPGDAPFYLNIFQQNKDLAYFALNLGAHTRLLVLDTGHHSAHFGAQLDFIKAELEKMKDRPNRLAMYHIPLYPSYRPDYEPRSLLGRKTWGKVFDQHSLTLAFENHEHTFKRTKKIYNEKVSSDRGTIYLGDGAWGVDTRVLKEKEPRWYIEKSAPLHHLWVVDASSEGLKIRALDPAGKKIDELFVAAETPRVSRRGFRWPWQSK